MRQIEKLYQKLSAGEKKRFRVFLNSPYFNVHPRNIEFWESFHSRKGNLESMPEKWKVMKTKQLNLLVSNLYLLMVRFLEQQAFEKDSSLQAIVKGEIALEKEDQSQWNKFQRMVKKRPLVSDEKDYLLLYENHRLNYKKGRARHLRSSSIHERIIGVISSVAKFSILEALRYKAELTSSSNVLYFDPPQVDHKKLLATYPSDWWEKERLIQLYLTLVGIQERSPEKPYLESFVNSILLEKSEKWSISEIDQNILLNLVLNTLIQHVRQTGFGMSAYEKLFYFYFLLIEKDAPLLRDEISFPDYKNICLVAIKVGKVDWASDFSDKFHHKLPQDVQNEARFFNLGMLSYYSGRFEEASSYLKKIESVRDPLIELDIRNLQTKIFVDHRDLDSLGTCLNNFEIWIKRNRKISRKRLKPHLKAIQVAKKLFRQIQILEDPAKSGSQKVIIKLKDEISKNDSLSNNTVLKKLTLWMNELLD